MIRYLIKNNLKLMFRNKWSIVFMILGPVLVITALSGAFSQLLKSYEGVHSFKAGYRLEDESAFSSYISVIKEAGEENGITFYEYPDGKSGHLMEDNDLAGFVVFGRDEYVVYKTGDYEVEGIALEYFMDKMVSSGSRLQQGLENSEDDVTGLVEKLDYMPAVNANDYYGIIYIVYFCWCGFVCATGMLSNEKKYEIGRKFQVSALSGLQVYLARLIPIQIVVSAGMGISTVVSAWLFDIHWGNPWLSALLLFIMILGASAFSLMLYYISGNLVITVIVLFTSIWCMGFVGGSFETYMFSSFSDTLKNMSPIYHANRALVELSCMGHSDYVGSSVLYMTGITFASSAAALLVDALKRRGRA